MARWNMDIPPCDAAEYARSKGGERMPMTPNQVRRMHQLEEARHHAEKAMIASGICRSRRNDLPYVTVVDAADPALVKARDTANAALQAFEERMIAQGRAYRGTWGRLLSY